MEFGNCHIKKTPWKMKTITIWEHKINKGRKVEIPNRDRVFGKDNLFFKIITLFSKLIIIYQCCIVLIPFLVSLNKLGKDNLFKERSKFVFESKKWFKQQSIFSKRDGQNLFSLVSLKSFLLR